MKQVYVIPFECVEHLIEGGKFTDREKAKRIGVKCGNLMSIVDFEEAVNDESLNFEENVILID